MMKGLITAVLIIFMLVVGMAQTKKPQAKPTQKSVAAPTPSLLKGKEVYTKYCIACHQKDGGGVPRLNPPIIKTEYVLGDKSRLVKIILKGFNQPLEIEDEEYTNPMPAQPHLTDAQISNVLTYIRNSFGNKASAITEAEVKAVRAQN